MPRKNFENIGDLQGYEYLKGVITDDPDTDTDTCTVRVKVVAGEAEDGSVSYEDHEFENTPIFYHCEEDSAEREDNGAILGAAAGFAINDEVIVLKQRPGLDDKIFVIGHLGGIKSCECFVEPFDGPLVTTKWPWDHSYEFFGYGTYPPDNSEISVTDGGLEIVVGPMPADGLWDQQIHQWFYFPTNPIRPNAKRVIFAAEASIACDETAQFHFYYLELFCEIDGEDCWLDIYVVSNLDTAYYDPIGCSDHEYEAADWKPHYSTPGYHEVWDKTILNNDFNYITLPVVEYYQSVYSNEELAAKFSIDLVKLSHGDFSELTAAAGGFTVKSAIIWMDIGIMAEGTPLQIDGGTMTVKHLEIC